MVETPVSVGDQHATTTTNFKAAFRDSSLDPNQAARVRVAAAADAMIMRQHQFAFPPFTEADGCRGYARWRRALF